MNPRLAKYIAELTPVQATALWLWLDSEFDTAVAQLKAEIEKNQPDMLELIEETREELRG